MTGVELYLAIGIPTLAVLLGILTNVIQWNAMNARFNNLDIKFDTLTGKVIDVDNRVTRIQAKLGIG